VLLSTPLHASSNFTVSVQLANKRGLKKLEDGPHGPNHVVSEWVEIIISNFVAIDGHFNKVVATNATGCNPQH
jgi:hypothetical protein